MKQYNNIAWIYEPHFNTKCFRVAKSLQQGVKENYIVVMCSPSYNGVYKYDASKVKDFETWFNKKTPCYCVPIDECILVKALEDIDKKETRDYVRAMQIKWAEGRVVNKDAHKALPDWILK